MGRTVQRVAVAALYLFLGLFVFAKIVFRESEGISQTLEPILFPAFCLTLLLGSIAAIFKSVSEFKERHDSRVSALVDCLIWVVAYSLAFLFVCYILWRNWGKNMTW